MTSSPIYQDELQYLASLKKALGILEKHRKALVEMHYHIFKQATKLQDEKECFRYALTLESFCDYDFARQIDKCDHQIRFIRYNIEMEENEDFEYDSDTAPLSLEQVYA